MQVMHVLPDAELAGWLGMDATGDPCLLSLEAVFYGCSALQSKLGAGLMSRSCGAGGTWTW